MFAAPSKRNEKMQLGIHHTRIRPKIWSYKVKDLMLLDITTVEKISDSFIANLGTVLGNINEDI